MEEGNTNYTPSNIPPVYPAENPKIEKPRKTIPPFIGIAIVVLVALILFGGVFAYQYFSAKSQPVVKIDQTANYFEIKEVGLKFEITDNLKDLVYVIKNESNGDKTILFSTKSLEEYGDYCNTENAPSGVLLISQKRSTGEIAVPYLISLDNLYVSYMGPQAACSEIKSAQDLQSSQLSSLREALKTITKIEKPTDQTAGLNSQFEIRYPADFVDVNNLTIAQLDPLYTYMGACLWSKNLPLPPVGTDFCYIGNQKPDGFATASLRITTDSSISAQDCQKSESYGKPGESDTSKTETINNIIFYHSKLDDAATGHFLSADYYKTYYQGVCYKINLSTETYRYLDDKENIGPGPSAEFLSAMDSKLKSIVSTFKFIK